MLKTIPDCCYLEYNSHTTSQNCFPLSFFLRISLLSIYLWEFGCYDSTTVTSYHTMVITLKPCKNLAFVSFAKENELMEHFRSFIIISRTDNITINLLWFCACILEGFFSLVVNGRGSHTN